MSKIYICPKCSKEYESKEAKKRMRICECGTQLREKKEKKEKQQYEIEFNNFTIIFALPVKIGRNYQEELKNDKFISREHCEILEENGIIYVIDYSTNGVFINGEKIKTKTSIKSEDKIKLANIEGVFKEKK